MSHRGSSVRGSDVGARRQHDGGAHRPTARWLIAFALVLLSACSTPDPSSGRVSLALDESVLLPGGSVRITGQAFGAAPGAVRVGADEVPADDVAWADDQITVTITGRTGSGPVSVELPSGEIHLGPVVQVVNELVALPITGGNFEPGTRLPEPFTVILTDTSGRPVAGVELEFHASGGSLSSASGRTDASGMARTFLTLPERHGSVTIGARGYCAAPGDDCYVRAQTTYDNLTAKHYVLGAPLRLSDGADVLPGWLRLEESAAIAAAGSGTGSATARVLTANARPGERNGLHPAALGRPGGAPFPYPAMAPTAEAPAPTELLVSLVADRDAPQPGLPALALAASLGLPHAPEPTLGGQARAAPRPRLESLGAVGVDGTELLRVAGGADIGELLDRLAADPRVLVVEPNYHVSLAPLPNDAHLHEQWGTFAVGAPVAWHTETGAGSEIVVAIVDSGVALHHPELAGRLLPGYDFCADETPLCLEHDADAGAYAAWNWHGTHVAGTVAASIDNGVGVTGVAPGVRLLPVKVFPDSSSGVTTVATLIAAVRWAAGLPVMGVPDNPNPAHVINLSLGGEFRSVHLQKALDEVRARGVVVVAAAGNDSAPGRASPVEFPAAARGVIAVGSVDPDLTRSAFSNHGAGRWGPGGVDVVAPGSGITSTIPYGLAAMSGTSMATPHVAGAAALLLAQDPSRTPAEVEALLKGSAYFDPTYMNDGEYGAGLLRVDGALGLPAPSGPTDRYAAVTLEADAARPVRLAGVLDLLTGESEPFVLPGAAAGTRVGVSVTWRGRSFGADAQLVR